MDKIANLEPKYFKAGEIQFEKGNYERAFLYFRFAWILNPTDTSVFMQSYSLIKMKKFEKAEQEIEAIRDIELYEKAYNLLDSAQQEVDRQVRASQTQRFTAYLDYSEGHNSNPNTEGKSSDEEIEADTEVTTLLGASYIFSNTVSRNMAFSTDYYYTQMKDDRFSRSTGLSFGLPFNWKPSDTFSWNITPQYERTTYADEDYIANSTASTTIDFYWGNLLFTTSASYLDYSELQSDYSYLGGYGTTASLTLAYYFTFSDFSITASMGNDNLEDTDDSVGSNINTGMTLALGISFSDRHYLSNSITVTSSTYDEDADGFSRKEETTTITSTLTYTVDAYLPTIYGKINIIQNTSTLDGDDDTDDYNYDQTTISLGTSYYF